MRPEEVEYGRCSLRTSRAEVHQLARGHGAAVEAVVAWLKPRRRIGGGDVATVTARCRAEWRRG